MTSENGYPVWSATYLPYGYEMDPQIGVNNYKFTGHERDSATEGGLDHTWYRQYASTMGRWLTPDPGGRAVVDPFNPQSWNRYAYVNNNPMNAVDPLGLDCENPQNGPCEITVTATPIDVPFIPIDPCRDWGMCGFPHIPGTDPSDYIDVLSLQLIVPNSAPKSIANNGLFSKIKNWIPTVCAGGGFGYSGGEVEAGPVKAELIGVVAYDSKDGGQHGGIVAGGLGPFTGGIESTRTWSDWQEHTSNIGFVNGASTITPRKLGPMDITKSNYGGLAQLNNGQLTIGGYAGLETKRGRTFGTGAYLTLSWTGCH